ncbi:MAG TPA: ribonuclease Y [Chloroflexota bacterium]|nr:ribonuclease Y [Chloroflexota bacterium]
MNGPVLAVIAAVGGLIVGAAVVYFWARLHTSGKATASREEAERAVADAQAQAKELILAAKEEAHAFRATVEEDARERRSEVQRLERRVLQREENLDRRSESLEKRERQLTQREEELEQQREKIDELIAQQRVELERVSGLNREEATEMLLRSIEVEVRDQANRMVRQIEAEAKEEADERARRIIVNAIQRWASDQVSESSVSVVPLPGEEMKGRIIGREGRNIRALEMATGVDLIIDDTPEAVILSGFDPVRREIARQALQKLIQDGRIHPARIEEMVEKARSEVETIIKEEGERAAFDAGVPGLNPDLIKALGRLHFRYSMGQNVLKHSVESAHLASMMAAEMGADVNVARRAALLHDIGKGVSHEVEGPHALIGADIAKRLGQPAKVVHAIAAHHFEEEPQTVEAFLVQAADAISGARPGARRDSLESYVKRLEALENIANSFEGVEKSFAIQAGREVRIVVKPEDVDDLMAARIARDIVNKIEETLEYPGQIKVMVIREKRVVDYAK